ncbi:hypothetical protein [Arcobacter sp. CECT 8985]|uniref:hypothetical protein n=1 Tax=Arcobacter sp. CECT 8985 TaxID=1935424 RepID=UPI0013E904F5|nr:hypothetical protein [Arcobacter sp. CECT 8985]
MKSSSYTLYEELKTNSPEGVNIELQPISMAFKDSVPSPDQITTALNIDINITIDLTKIAYVTAAAWIANKYISVRSKENNLKAIINDREIPIARDESQKLIDCEVRKEVKNNQSTHKVTHNKSNT